MPATHHVGATLLWLALVCGWAACALALTPCYGGGRLPEHELARIAKLNRWQKGRLFGLWLILFLLGLILSFFTLMIALAKTGDYFSKKAALAVNFSAMAVLLVVLLPILLGFFRDHVETISITQLLLGSICFSLLAMICLSVTGHLAP